MLTVSNPGVDSVASESRSVVWTIVRSVGKLLALVTCLWFLHQQMPDAQTLTGAWQQWLSGDPLVSLLLFIVGGALFVSVGLPRQTLALVGGYAYGTLAGCVLAVLVTVIGSALTYTMARGLGRPRLQRRFPSQLAKFDGWTADHVFAKTLALRLFPVGSNLVTNVAAGICHASVGPFLLASLIGFVPQTLVFALSGTAIGQSSGSHMLMAVVMLVASIVIGGYVYKGWRHR